MDAVALFKDVTAGTHRRRLAVDEQLPVLAGLLVIAEREALIERRDDGVESPAPAAVGVVVGFQPGLTEQLLGQVGRGSAVCKREILRGSPRLLIALCINADYGARSADLRIHDAAGADDRDGRGDFLVR